MRFGLLSLSLISFVLIFFLKIGVANTTVMTWSWWWVTLPLWGMLAFIPVVVVSVVVMILLIIILLKLTELFCQLL